MNGYTFAEYSSNPNSAALALVLLVGMAAVLGFLRAYKSDRVALVTAEVLAAIFSVVATKDTWPEALAVFVGVQVLVFIAWIFSDWVRTRL